MRPSSRRRFLRNGAKLGSAIAAAPLASAADGNETLKTLHSLRTIHGNFSDQRVPDDKVEAVIDASVRAANASNMQSYSIVVSRDAGKIQKLTGYQGNCLLFTAPITTG